MTHAAVAAAAVLHPLAPLDRVAMAKIRETLATAPKGLPDRVTFDEIIGHTLPAEGVSFEASQVGGVRGWWCRPKVASTRSAILYLHGGAYVLGSAQAYRNFVSQIASRARSVAFIPDYPLAPETPFPGAVRDTQAAYRGLVREGITDISLVGDSAGGGLALALLALTTVEAGEGISVRPKGAVAMSPWTDLALTGESLRTRADTDPLLTKAALVTAATSYLGGHDPRDPEASPLYGNLTDLPPVQLHVGEDEILFDDARRYADNIATAHGVVQLHTWEGMPHVFPTNIGMLHAADVALDAIASFLSALPNNPTTRGSKLDSDAQSRATS